MKRIRSSMFPCESEHSKRMLTNQIIQKRQITFLLDSCLVRSWDDVSAALPGVRSLDRYCFRAPYIASLVRDGLQIADDSGLEVRHGA